MIKIDRLNKNFGNNEVLKDISLEFTEGNVYGIVGENGAGKTTLFRCIAGLESYRGEILSENTPLKNHLGYLETEPFFYSRITGKEYIQLLCNARNKKVNIDEKNIFDLPLEQYASTYSTGMKKKLALTAILLQENKYYILDEPFNGIDIQSSIILVDIILKLKELNKIVLISSHIFSTLVDTCDKIIFLNKGQEPRIIQKAEFKDLEKEMKSKLILKDIEDIIK
ncbi:ATP-binding cassette domain-containing protein [Ornithobacterium rhinotracheale]|uniref:ABC transporter ATP-binding protein n=1 Tax=Ornithobacterium rhinotracheale TaxID=28251 RepID=UPI00129CEF5D|nr:ATP-binding cassette domain-containing protein [Ornithobacterium rhinotracheale]MRJ11616.1 ATP-binding cassette domain-containing protein [Ornithobacterium rhinotracheale]